MLQMCFDVSIYLTMFHTHNKDFFDEESNEILDTSGANYNYSLNPNNDLRSSEPEL